MKGPRYRMVTDHALEQLRERAAESVRHMTDRALSGRLDGAVEANFAKSTSIKFKGRECWLVELGHSFAVPLYAAVVDAEKKSRYRQVITTVLTMVQFDENQKTGKWSGWFSPGPLKATMGERLKGKR